MEIEYADDILGDGFERHTIPLGIDYEGEAVATLVRRRADKPSDRAVLYIHGFNDYFFQSEMARRFNAHGENFYALDLRKYGRSYLPHQKINDIYDIRDYYEEITAALGIIKSEGNEKTILMGHSTGGLILTLFAKERGGSGLFDGLILNSPFFEFNLPFIQMCLLPIVSILGKVFRKVRISGGFSAKYGLSLHRSNGGEWDYDLGWKPYVAPRVNLGWIRAIHCAHKELRKPFDISCPVLVMRSATSACRGDGEEAYRSKDAILNVKDIEKIGRNIKGDVRMAAIEGGVHDLVLSREPVRDEVYGTMLGWIDSRFV